MFNINDVRILAPAEILEKFQEAVCPQRRDYDEAYHNTFKKRDSKWLVTKFEIAGQKKQELLQLARSGGGRPLRNTPLGYALKRFIDRNGLSYDFRFDKEIHTLRPDWFIKREPLVKSNKAKFLPNKAKLLQKARDGKDKPAKGTKLERALQSYTAKNSHCYDPEFDRKIRALRPDWFFKENKALRDSLIKQELLQLAKDGKKRPAEQTKLGFMLKSFISKGRYCDPEFDKEIRALRPDWFRSRRTK